MITQDKFPLLRAVGGIHSNTGPVGGRYVVPAEFDTKKFASAFYPEGNEVSAMESDQPVVGTSLTAPGWKVWKYPQYVGDGKNKEEHPKAGKPHKVSSTSTDGKTLVLMFRPLAIQKQVNEAYGEVSRKLMINEIQGVTLQPAAATTDRGEPDRGMLTNRRLVGAGDGVDVEVDESDPGSAVVEPTLTQEEGKITIPPRKIKK